MLVLPLILSLLPTRFEYRFRGGLTLHRFAPSLYLSRGVRGIIVGGRDAVSPAR